MPFWFWIVIAYVGFMLFHMIVMQIFIDSFKEFNIWSLLYVIFTPFTIGLTIGNICSTFYDQKVALDELSIVDASNKIEYQWNSVEDFTNWVRFLQSRGKSDAEIAQLGENVDKYIHTVMQYIQSGDIVCMKKSRRVVMCFPSNEEGIE